jgi:hypothetical protein
VNLASRQATVEQGDRLGDAQHQRHALQRDALGPISRQLHHFRSHADLPQRVVDGGCGGPDFAPRPVDGQGKRSSTLEHDTTAVVDGAVRGRSQGVFVLDSQTRCFQSPGYR